MEFKKKKKKSNNCCPLKYLSNFRGSLEMSLINCKVELKLKWTKCCALFAAGNDNESDDDIDINANNIIFTIKNTKVSVSVVILSARGNQRLSKLLNKVFERSVYWNEYKTKSDNKNTTTKYRHFLESNFVEVNRLFQILVYSNQDDYAKN